MPTYAYACTECDHSFEIVQSFKDDSLTVCPECGGRLRKVFNSVGVVFKGSGFYRTDSRSEGNGKGRSASNVNGSSDTKPSGSTGPSGTPDSASSGSASPSSTSSSKASAAASSGASSTGSGSTGASSTS